MAGRGFSWRGYEVAVQTLVERKSLRDVDWGSVAISGAAGAIGGGLAAKTAKLGFLAKNLIEGGIDAGASIAEQVHETGAVSGTTVLLDVAGGRTLGAIAGNAAEGATRNCPQVQGLVKEADRKARIAGNAADAGNTSRANARTAQANSLNATATGIVATRATAASGAASEVGSTAYRKAHEEYQRRKREEEKRQQGGGQ